ncbi:MAG: DUF1223 domain-containing protein, partial [Asticcacaulis sp.]
ARTAPEPSITLEDGRLHVAAAPAAFNNPAQVWWVAYEPKSLDVPISAGENSGRTLPHRHIVKALVKLGEWSGRAADFKPPATPAGLRTVVMVQAAQGGPIVAAKAF